MGTYNPPAFPRRPKVSTPLSELRYEVQILYYRYEINTALYVMSAGEKIAFNLVLVLFLVLSFSTIYYCLPQALSASIRRIAHYYGGSSNTKLSVAGVAGAEVMKRTSDAMASLAESNARMNASSAFAI